MTDRTSIGQVAAWFLHYLQGEGTLRKTGEKVHRSDYPGLFQKTIELEREVNGPNLNVKIEMIKANLDNFGLELRKYEDNPGRQMATVKQYAGKDGIAAINAGFYKNGEITGNLHLGCIIINGKVVSSPLKRNGQAILSAYVGIRKSTGKVEVGKIQGKINPAEWDLFLQTGPLGLKQGRINPQLQAMKHNNSVSPERDLSAIGLTGNNEVVFIKTHSKIPCSLRGISYVELSEQMAKQGVADMVFLDSGHSSSIFSKARLNITSGSKLTSSALVLRPKPQKI
ncbi:MAG: phosphodiester glycosidase family protein [Candidatus Margulisbacteria bacterium]|nr:phosphodiester glycosidase family protein [Candidatus Margulisiibacteriota bacterium]